MINWMFVEKMIYELKPYVFLFAALAVLLSNENKTPVLVVSCLTLVTCSLTILRWRYLYRYHHRGERTR